MIIENTSNQYNYSCYYVDHTFFDAREIGKLYSGPLKEVKGLINEQNSVLFSTCQRIELYTIENDNPIKCLSLPFKEINGALEVTKRLTSICSGIYSQILGEKNIIEQAKITHKNIPKKNVIKQFFDKGLYHGEILRESFSFYAKKSYEDIALNLLEASDINNRSEDLIIVGSGMLARGILEVKKIFKKYKNIYFITRDTKNLRKRIPTTIENTKISAIKIEKFAAEIKTKYHCIIATTNINNEYIKLIYDIITNKKCLGVFDLSSHPLLEKQLQAAIYYSDIYHKDYLNAVTAINQTMHELSNEILFRIKDMDKNE